MTDFGSLRGLNAYEVLGVAEAASSEEIVAAHRRLISQTHPDRAGSTLFAQLVNEARQVLLNQRAEYDAWRLSRSRGAPSSSDQASDSKGWSEASSGTPGSTAGGRGPTFVRTDGRPGYFTPPGAVPAPVMTPPPRIPNSGNGSRGVPPQSGPGLGPSGFTGRLHELAEEAYVDMFRAVGPANGPTQAETYGRSADLLAALRFYRDAVARAFSDDLISDALSSRPADAMGSFIANISRSPYTPERDQALGVLRYVHSSPSAGVYVALARLAIQRKAGRA